MANGKNDVAEPVGELRPLITFNAAAIDKMTDCIQTVQNAVGDVSSCVATIGLTSANTGGQYCGNGMITNIPNSFPPSYPPFQPMIGTDTVTEWNIQTNIDPCKDFHTVTEQLLEADEDQVVGYCDKCGIRVFIPKVPGAFSFERAGGIIGKAMALDDEDDLGELLGELAELEKNIKRDQKRLERARELLQIARTMANKNAIKQLTVGV